MWVHVTIIIYYLFLQDVLLLTSINVGNIENVRQSLISGANVNVHHCGEDQVSTLIK